MESSASTSFYARLPATADFDIIAGGSGYAPVPDDWTILVSDVVDSTGAIERGEYKAVNMVGAASIVAVLNACDGIDLPFMFGGDGGVILVPPDVRRAAISRLATLRDRSAELYGLHLRAAAIPVTEVRQAGADVLVQKFSLAGNNTLAMFAGGGLSLADAWLKREDGNGHHLPADASGKSLDLTGLSCRWQPLKSQNGVMLTLIVQASGARLNPAQIGRAFERVLGAPVGRFAPVQDANLVLEPAGSKAYRLETAGLRSSMGRIGSWAWTRFTGIAQRWADRSNSRIGSYDAPEWRKELRTNTDFRKFDGTLRLVIDVSAAQADKLEDYLNRAAIKGDLAFGAWRSDAALMTCLLFDMKQSLHVHFIDGADGGYTRAARKLKQSLSRRA
jgi:hypothetical protein